MGFPLYRPALYVYDPVTGRRINTNCDDPQHNAGSQASRSGESSSNRTLRSQPELATERRDSSPPRSQPPRAVANEEGKFSSSHVPITQSCGD